MFGEPKSFFTRERKTRQVPAHVFDLTQEAEEDNTPAKGDGTERGKLGIRAEFLFFSMTRCAMMYKS